MNRSDFLRRLHQARMPLLVIAAALLLLLGTGNRSGVRETASQAENNIASAAVAEEEQRLAQTLQAIDGVGKTRVPLSVHVSTQTDYLKDEDQTVVLSAGGGKQQALAFRTRGAEYLGAVIVCEGGDDPNAKWSVLEAVSNFTGLRADQITVLKLQES